MAAEVLATAGIAVTVYEHMASVGRKLLLAGRSGLNLTHARPPGGLIAQYGSSGPRLAPALEAFGPSQLRDWAHGLGETTFVGSTGRVFPVSKRATPLLRAWITRLRTLGVGFELRHRWAGWSSGGALIFTNAEGARLEAPADAVVLALGGASWPRVGSDGGWAEHVGARGVEVTRFSPANSGVVIDWSSGFRSRFAGTPLKNVGIFVAGRSIRGDVMVTSTGLEGGAIYPHGPAIRDALDRDGSAALDIDLQPDRTPAMVLDRLALRRPKDSFSNGMRHAFGLSQVAIAVMREAGAVPADVKATRLPVVSLAPLDRAISTAGGIAWPEVDDGYMLRRLPGTFVAGEMIDWEAPTGGYLLQATFSTGVAAAKGLLQWLDQAEVSAARRAGS